jgi:hypothetical protein
MRIESSVTSVSWIPSEAVAGLPKLGFISGLTHYDEPPPDGIESLQKLEELFSAERFRFANRLSAWIDVQDGRVIDAGYSGRGYISRTRARLGPIAEVVFQPVEFPELREAPEMNETEVRFVQTTGGRTRLPAPRPVRRRPLAQWSAPTVWTTLALTIAADGSSKHEFTGASLFPRHWIYAADGRLAGKSGLADSHEWFRRSFGVHSPWGNEDSKPFVTVVESTLERQLSGAIMRGGERPSIRKLRVGSFLTTEGEAGNEVYLLLDGVLEVSVENKTLGELGPGAVVGERAVLEGGCRTASLRAVTNCTVAVAGEGQIDREKLMTLAEAHHQEDLPTP